MASDHMKIGKDKLRECQYYRGRFVYPKRKRTDVSNGSDAGCCLTAFLESIMMHKTKILDLMQ